MHPLRSLGVLREWVPTAANLNLYRGRFSRVDWHSDNEPLFGARGGVEAHCFNEFRYSGALQVEGRVLSWTDEADSCWLDHGDHSWSWMANVRTSFFTVRILVWEQERINITFRWIKQHVASCSLSEDRGGMLFANVCAGFHRFLPRSLWGKALSGDSWFS